jgi:HAD superfamily hydrolase (TIGR01549 family)
MTARSRNLAIDVGGVLYYDEPFELAWLQGVHDRLSATYPAATVKEFIQRMNDFYLRPRTALSAPPSFFSPLGTESWHDVRSRWTTLVQPITGAVDALARLTEEHSICIVANQPPECAAALKELGIEPLVELVALDSVVGYAKPDPQLYQWAFDRLAWDPRSAVVIGDRMDHDVAPAMALGCEAALIRPDADWFPPPGTHPEIVAAYRALRAERIRAAEPASVDWTADNLAGLADQLRSNGQRGGGANATPAPVSMRRSQP